jgi:hypothetical protein
MEDFFGPDYIASLLPITNSDLNKLHEICNQCTSIFDDIAKE